MRILCPKGQENSLPKRNTPFPSAKIAQLEAAARGAHEKDAAAAAKRAQELAGERVSERCKLKPFFIAAGFSK